MLAVEIILICVGVACICGSFFISRKKNPDDVPEEGTARSADIWTEKDEEVIIKHIDEVLEKRGMELVETTEDQMNRICNEKIMAIDEFTKPLLDKIHVNHEEVVFMYNMLGEKQKEIRREIEEDTLRKAVPVINPVEPAVDEEILNRLPQVESEEPAPAPAPVHQRPEETEDDGLTGLQRAHQKMETIPGAPDPESPFRTNTVPEVSTGQPIHPVDVVGSSKGNEVGSRRTVFSAHQYEPVIQEPVPPEPEPMVNQSITPIMPVETPKPKPAPTPVVPPTPAKPAGGEVRTGIERLKNEPEPEQMSPTEKMKRPSKELIIQQMEEASAGSPHGEAIEDRVRRMYKQGRSVVDISKELHMGQGEVKLMIAMYNKRR